MNASLTLFGSSYQRACKKVYDLTGAYAPGYSGTGLMVPHVEIT